MQSAVQLFKRFSGVASVLLLVGCAAQAPVPNLVAYYQIGLNDTPWARWDTYVVDASSVRPDGKFVRYRSFRVTSAGTDTVQEVRADCKTGTRGQATSDDMYSTFGGTLNGEEVKAACALLERKDRE